jgi:hypothetical protein
MRRNAGTVDKAGRHTSTTGCRSSQHLYGLSLITVVMGRASPKRKDLLKNCLSVHLTVVTKYLPKFRDMLARREIIMKFCIQSTTLKEGVSGIIYMKF